MKMQTFPRFKRHALVVALSLCAGFGASVYAANDKALADPQSQTCSIMEILYQGDRAVSYKLPCNAGDWQLSYTGAVPAGTGKTATNYRLTVAHPQSGASFSIDRRLELPSVAVLGRALLREAVLLQDGDVGLRDCDKAGCSNYRPLGAIKRLQSQHSHAVPSTIDSTKEEKGTESRISSGNAKTVASTDSKYSDNEASIKAKSEVANLSARTSHARYGEVQSFSPSTITKGGDSKASSKDNTDTDIATKAATGANPGIPSATAKDMSPAVDTVIDQLQKDNAALKVERTSLKSTVDEQARHIDEMHQRIDRLQAAIDGLKKQAPVASILPAPLKDNASSTTKAEASETKVKFAAQDKATDAVEGAKTATKASANKVNPKVAKKEGVSAKGNKDKSSSPAGKATQPKGIKAADKKAAAKPLPPKTSQDVKPVRAPKPSAATPEKGHTPEVVGAEYYRVTPEGSMKVYRVKAPAIIEVLVANPPTESTTSPSADKQPKQECDCESVAESNSNTAIKKAAQSQK